MTPCPSCQLGITDCICSLVDEFLSDDNFDLILQDLAELEESEKLGSKRCLDCYNYACKCKKTKENI